jgi:phosphonate transport system permease protein
MPEVIAFWLYRFEINIRAAAVLGVVGAGGIGFILQQAISFTRFPRAGMIILVVVAVTILVDTVSGWIRRRIIEGAEAKRLTEAEQPELVEASPARIERP